MAALKVDEDIPNILESYVVSRVADASTFPNLPSNNAYAFEQIKKNKQTKRTSTFEKNLKFMGYHFNTLLRKMLSISTCKLDSSEFK